MKPVIARKNGSAKTAATSIPTSNIVSIDPEYARALLDKNTHNRNVRANAVKQYASDMSAGRWSMSPDAITIDVDGRLLNGQHRLLAVVQSNTPITAIVATGFPSEAQETMDGGKARTVGDVLRLRGEKNPNELAATLRRVAIHLRDGSPVFFGGGICSSREQTTTLDAHPEIREHVAWAMKRRDLRPMLSVPLVATMRWIFAASDADDADLFFETLMTGEGLAKGNPIYTLRERLLRSSTTRGVRIPPDTKLIYVIKSWNAWRLGQRLSLLKWNTGEEIPQIVG